MTGRARQILGRFPAHLEATAPGKQLGDVTEALARDLDVQAADLAAIRRSHRLDDADEAKDLWRIAARHGIARSEFAILFARFERAHEALDALATAANPADRDEAAEALLELWGLDAPRPLLPLFAPPVTGGGSPDLDAAHRNLLREIPPLLASDAILDAVRQRVTEICRRHVRGNGSIRAVIAGAANALDLDVDLERISHSADRYFHAAAVRDRLRLRPDLAPAPEWLGIEENPLERVETEPVGRVDGELFSLIRRGFERALLQVRLVGKENLTLGPQVVNRDEGHGIGFSGAVPAGQPLRFEETGRVFLDDADVTSLAFAWKGACFGGADSRPNDFIFDDPRSVFAVAFPDGSLDADFEFPHAGNSLPVPGLAVGETRFAFFEQVAHFSFDDGTTVHRIAPRPGLGIFDGSVNAPGGSDPIPVSALVSFSWLERRAFCARVLIPPRFRALTPKDPDGTETLQRVAQALRRFRPAGVELVIQFIEDRWVLGQSTLPSITSQDIKSRLRSGTALWSVPPQDR